MQNWSTCSLLKYLMYFVKVHVHFMPGRSCSYQFELEESLFIHFDYGWIGVWLKNWHYFHNAHNLLLNRTISNFWGCYHLLAIAKVTLSFLVSLAYLRNGNIETCLLEFCTLQHLRWFKYEVVSICSWLIDKLTIHLIYSC